MRWLRGGDSRANQLHIEFARIHFAAHLQQGKPRHAGVHDRGAAGAGTSTVTASGATGGNSDGTLMDAPAIIDVRGLTKRYGDRTVVDHVDMQVERGRIHGFLGPNGSGKTTTIRMLCGLLTPDEGSGTCLGFDLRKEARKIKRQVGYMTQKFGLYEDLSIEENLEFIARVYEMPEHARKVQATLDQLG